MGCKCCVDCFANEWVRQYIRGNSTATGTCDYCERKEAKLLDVGALYEPFHNLMALYVRSDSPHGEALIDLIQGDYEVFDDDLFSSGGAARMVEDIMDAGWDDDSGEPPVDPRELYQRHPWYHDTMAEEWEEFSRQVKDDPTREPDLPAPFEEELGRLEARIPKGTTLYRARPGFVIGETGVERPWKGRDIGAPPREKATPGRANFEGEVVLYTADEELTAIAEVRPWRGLLVSVAKMQAADDLRVVDLSRRPPSPNPFTDEVPRYERELEELLIAFGEELARPLRRADSPSDYLPCQKLVRRIQESGSYDGIRYPSAMSPGGTNVVLFDPAGLQIGRSRLVEVKDVAVKYGSAKEDW